MVHAVARLQINGGDGWIELRACVANSRYMLTNVSKTKIMSYATLVSDMCNIGLLHFLRFYPHFATFHPYAPWLMGKKAHWQNRDGATIGGRYM